MGQKQEKTHTWYGMSLPDGTPLDMVNAISHAWTGRWPKDRAPRITAPRAGRGSGTAAELRLPGAAGNSRMFVCAKDASGKAATANRAVRVSPN